MSKQQRMHIVAIAAFGGPERLTLMEMPKPVPGPDEVLIRVQAAGVGLWDVKVRRGQVGERPFPLVLGWESAGTIEQVGTNVAGFAVGEAVYGYVRQVGHCAEYVAAPASLVARRPHSMDATHAAAIPISGLTAHQAITEDLGLRAGETVLITVAAGGTGTLAVQMATSLGAYVIATASARNHHYLRELGAQEVIDYTTTDFVQAVRAAHPAGVDAVLDCIGGETTRRSLGALRDGGRLAHLTEATDLPKAAQVSKQGASPMTVSIFDRTALTEAFAGHDAVVNLATAIPPTAKFMQTKAWTENDRVRKQGSAAIIDAVIAAGIERVVQESVSMIYPDRADEWIDEQCPPDTFPMAQANLAAEANADRFSTAGGRGVVLRFGWFYGPGATHSEEFFTLARRHIAMMMGPPKSYVSSIHVADAATAVVAALAVAAGTYNVVDDEPVTKRSWADALAAAAGKSAWLRIPGRAALCSAIVQRR